MITSTTTQFYRNIGEQVRDTDTVLDLGAGRAAWGERDDENSRIRNMSDVAKTYLAADVDPAVFQSTIYDKVMLVEDGVIPMDDSSVDRIICDFVFEHVSDPAQFANEAIRILKPGGKLFARTPLRSNYVCVVSRLMSESAIQRLLSHAQPSRELEDHFEVCYKLNTEADLRAAFPGARLSCKVVRTNPNYMVNIVTRPFLKALHNYGPKALSGMLLIELTKPS